PTRAAIPEHQALALRNRPTPLRDARLLRGARNQHVRRGTVRARRRPRAHPGARLALLSRRSERRRAERLQRRRPPSGAAPEPAAATRTPGSLAGPFRPVCEPAVDICGRPEPDEAQVRMPCDTRRNHARVATMRTDRAAKERLADEERIPNRLAVSVPELLARDD